MCIQSFIILLFYKYILYIYILQYVHRTFSSVGQGHS